MEKIGFGNWQKLDIRTGKILKIEDIEGADKLYKLEVDTGEKRTLVAGLKEHYKKEELEGKNCVVLCNLEPKTMKGIESEGMILAAVTEGEEKVVLIKSKFETKNGAKVEFKDD